MLTHPLVVSEVGCCLSNKFSGRLEANKSHDLLARKVTKFNNKKCYSHNSTCKFTTCMTQLTDEPNYGRRTANSLTLAMVASSLCRPVRAEDEEVLQSAQTFMYSGSSAKKSTGKYSFTTVTDEEVGFELDIPTGWVLESPGGRSEYHAPGDYGGKRVTVSIELLGKVKEPSLVAAKPEVSVREFAQQQADLRGKDANMGATARVIAVGDRDNGRYYYWESTLESFEPQHFWGVAGVGLGQNESARKFKLRQLVTIVCQIPEKEFKSDEDGEVLRQIVRSFNFIR